MTQGKCAHKSPKFWARPRAIEGLCPRAFDDLGLTAWPPIFPLLLCLGSHGYISGKSWSRILQSPYTGEPWAAFHKTESKVNSTLFFSRGLATDPLPLTGLSREAVETSQKLVSAYFLTCMGLHFSH